MHGTATCLHFFHDWWEAAAAVAEGAEEQAGPHPLELFACFAFGAGPEEAVQHFPKGEGAARA